MKCNTPASNFLVALPSKFNIRKTTPIKMRLIILLFFILLCGSKLAQSGSINDLQLALGKKVPPNFNGDVTPCLSL